jgi:hypothetical protein
MKARDVSAVLGVAAVTMAFALAALGPATLRAVDERSAITPMIAQAEFTHGGCRFTVATDKPSYAAGESPVLVVEATNTGAEPAEAEVWVTLLATEPVSPMARMMPVPRPVWSERCALRLAPGETKAVELTTGVALGEGQMVSIMLGAEDRTVMAGRLALPGALQQLRRLDQVMQNAQLGSTR